MRVYRNTHTANDPEAYVARFNADPYWASVGATMRLVEVIRTTLRGRKTFIVEVTDPRDLAR